MLQKVVAVALRKLQMGAMPDVEGQLSSFLGMPSSCRKSVLAPLDNIKELSLQWVLMPKLDSRGCIQVLSTEPERRDERNACMALASNERVYNPKYILRVTSDACRLM